MQSVQWNFNQELKISSLSSLQCTVQKLTLNTWPACATYKQHHDSFHVNWTTPASVHTMLTLYWPVPQQRTSRVEHWFDCTNHLQKQESHAVAGKPRDAAVNSDRYQVCWHFAGAISAGVLGQFSAQNKSDLHVLLSIYLFTGLLTAHYYYNSHCVQCGT